MCRRETPVFGDFWDRAAGLLRPPGQPGPPPEPQQVAELAVAMRGLAGTVGRYLEDVRIDVGVARGNPDVWNQALAEGRAAVRDAAAALDRPRCAAVWPQLEDGPGVICSDSLAGRLAAAVRSLTVARDLLHTHFTAGPDGRGAEHSDWAPVIASAPVNRALLAGLADHVGTVARQVQVMHLSGGIVGDHGHSPAGELWRHVRRAVRDLESFGMTVPAAQWQAPVPEAGVRLLKAIPLNRAPERRIPAASDAVPGLCAGTAGAARRVRHALRGSAGRARWAPDLTAEPMRHTAGRLAYADPAWTPARGPVHVLREPESPEYLAQAEAEMDGPEIEL